ncbi:MAG: alpha/beta fold hydrolase [Chloroflexi bacterium]|nr:alpha/beta fold hydrolase [Chloroflexota bacterium]
MPTATRLIAVPGGHLNVVIDGEGPPILLVHAGIVDLRAWDELVPRLVAAGHRVIRYDCRGFGSSTTSDVQYSNRADLRAVLDANGVERAVIVGNSRGAMIALDTILETPERAAAFVWVGGGIGGFEGRASVEELALFETADAAEEAHDIETLVDLEVRIWVDGVGQPATRVPAQIREAVRAMDLPLLNPDRITGTPVPLGWSANDRLGEIQVPVLAVVGALDVLGTREAAIRLEAAVPTARRVEIPDVAHMVGMEAPGQLADLIIDFVRPLGAWA